MNIIVKVFIFISVLFLGASVPYIIQLKHLKSDKDSSKNTQQKAVKAVTLVTETAKIEDIVWKEPQQSPKGEHWTFDLFTAPTISKEEGNFVAILPWLKKSPIMIPFEIISIEKKLYPLQFGGYFDTPIIAGVRSLEIGFSFMLRDTESNESLIAKLEQILEKYGVEVRKFEEKGVDGIIEGYPRLILWDSKLNKEVLLTSALTYYDTLWNIKLRIKADGKEIILSQIGEEFTIESDNYKLEEIDFGKKMLNFSQKMGKNLCRFSLSMTHNYWATIKVPKPVFPGEARKGE
ncbi:MAG: hypothetical protein LBS71_00200 [Puniceicoccales bacterium]|jgi:hypothetical protein|nr:hypothetical protein [Puniceicoccales bacterium]